MIRGVEFKLINFRALHEDYHYIEIWSALIEFQDVEKIYIYDTTKNQWFTKAGFNISPRTIEELDQLRTNKLQEYLKFTTLTFSESTL